MSTKLKHENGDDSFTTCTCGAHKNINNTINLIMVILHNNFYFELIVGDDNTGTNTWQVVASFNLHADIVFQSLN